MRPELPKNWPAKYRSFSDTRLRVLAWGVALGTAGSVVVYALEAGPLVDFSQIVPTASMAPLWGWWESQVASWPRGPWWRRLSRS
jgi:hypothetical protein